MEIIKVRNVSVKFQSDNILTDLSFDILKGDYVGIVGPNGSGKTTLIKTILGLITPSSGSISFEGSKGIHEFYHHMGYLPQNKGVSDPRFPAIVKEIVSLGLLSNKGFYKKIDRKDESAIYNVLHLLDIENLKNKLIGQLSGGEQQRVLLARAMVNSPQVLILDEPTTALDPQSRDSFYHILGQLNKEQGTTILLITHDVGTIGNYANKLLYIDERLIFYGTFDQFCHSEQMTDYFGEYSQHLICKRHS